MKYRVTLLPGQTQFDIHEGETILDAASRSGKKLPHRCRRGECGTCKAQVVEGDYELLRNLPASQFLKDNETLMCSARAKGDLTLQLDEQISNVSAFSAKVVLRELLAQEVLRVRLEPTDGECPNFAAGQYLNLVLNDKKVPFSIASAPENDQFIELHIRVTPGHAINDQVTALLQVDATVTIELAFGCATLQQTSGKPLLLVAGGTGFAPMKSMIESLLSFDREREITLYWGARTAELLYDAPVIQRWERYVPNFTYVPVVQESPNNSWEGECGLVHEVLLNRVPNLEDYDVFLSGSFDMVKAVYPLLLQAGLPREQLFSDMVNIIEGVDA